MLHFIIWTLFSNFYIIFCYVIFFQVFLNWYITLDLFSNFILFFVFCFQASQKRRWWNVGRIPLLFRFHGFYRANPAPWCGRTGVILGYTVSIKRRQSMAVFVENRSRSRIQSTSLSHDHGIHLLHGPR